MKKIVIFAVVCVVTLSVSAQVSCNLKTPADTLSYAVGLANSQGLVPFLEKQFAIKKEELPQFVEAFKQFIAKKDDRNTVIRLAGATIASQLSSSMVPQIQSQFANLKINPEIIYAGLFAGALSDTTIMTTSKAQAYFENQIKAEQEAKKQATKAAGEKFLAENAKKKDVKTLPSGLQYKVITQGTGPIPTKDQTVTVKYEGKLIDGTIFDSSYTRNPQTTDFKPTQVIKGWTEALTMMPVGSTWELYIPENLAYGSQAKPKIPACSVLIFKVELISVK